MITFPKDTPLRCNRCNELGLAPREFDANRENSATWRMSGMMTNPACGHPDGHWVFLSDLYEKKVVQAANDLSAGALATLTDKRKYDEVEAIQRNFVAFCAENWAAYAKWQDAWAAFEDTDANTWTPHEDDVCPGCGSDREDPGSRFCLACNDAGDRVAAHYGHD